MHMKLAITIFLVFNAELGRMLKYLNFIQKNCFILKITNGCRIGPRCELMTDEELTENTALCFEFGQRKNVEQSTIVCFIFLIKNCLNNYLEFENPGRIFKEIITKIFGNIKE